MEVPRALGDSSCLDLISQAHRKSPIYKHLDSGWRVLPEDWTNQVEGRFPPAVGGALSRKERERACVDVGTFSVSGIVCVAVHPVLTPSSRQLCEGGVFVPFPRLGNQSRELG